MPDPEADGDTSSHSPNEPAATENDITKDATFQRAVYDVLRDMLRDGVEAEINRPAPVPPVAVPMSIPGGDFGIVDGLPASGPQFNAPMWNQESFEDLTMSRQPNVLGPTSRPVSGITFGRRVGGASGPLIGAARQAEAKRQLARQRAALLISLQNGIGFEPQRLIKLLESSEAERAGNAQLARDHETLIRNIALSRPDLAESASFTGVQTDFRPGARFLRVCRLTVTDKLNQVKRGTGIFVSDELILTCRHTFGPSGQIANVGVDVPHHSGPLGQTPYDVFALRHYAISSSDGVPLFMAESPPRDRSIEIAEWPISGEQPPSLDYCIIKIVPGSEQWTIQARGARDDLASSNLGYVISKVGNQNPTLRPLMVQSSASELLDIPLTVHTVGEGMTLERIHGGQVIKDNDTLQRIRYGGPNIGVHPGDSGSPIADNNGRLLAMHNAGTTERKQAVPIGNIFEDIRERYQNIFQIIDGVMS